ncbi:TlpA family protein disulfide reductase [Chitinophaga sp. 22321]|uniref:TlpA family protein disulfide reductase n=1 Tax=Chitinophaga sp. 22321 TaxID=3453909 RepID=UPI003F866152
MNTKIIFLQVIFLLSIGNNSIGQNKLNAQQQTTGLTVGDSVPDILISNIINYKKRKVYLSDFKDKIVILDFWATSCSGCIQKLPLLDSLQNKYGDRIQILPVTFEPDSNVFKMLHSNSKLKNSALPFVTNDKVLSKYFKHVLIPHIAWIVKGKVVAITQSEYVTDHNIEAVIAGKIAAWSIKKDLFNVKTNSSLVELKPEIPKSTFFYSALIPFTDGLAPANGLQIDSNNKTVRYYAVNNSILTLYASTLATGELSNSIPLFYKQIELLVKDSSRYVFDANKMYLDEWERQNCYSYDGIFPIACSIDEIKDNMRASLNAYLNLQCKTDKVKTKCIVLSADPSSTNRLKTNGGKQIIHLSDFLEKQYFINVGISDIVGALNWHKSLPIVIDRTGIDYRMDIDLGELKISDIDSLINAFQQNGIKASIEYVTIKKLIIKEK